MCFPFDLNDTEMLQYTLLRAVMLKVTGKVPSAVLFREDGTLEDAKVALDLVRVSTEAVEQVLMVHDVELTPLRERGRG